MSELSGPQQVGPGRRRVPVGVLAAVVGVCLGVGVGAVPVAVLPAAGPAPAVSFKAAVSQGLESFYGQKAEWYDCVGTDGMKKSTEKTGFQCVKVTVPLDYSQPSGQIIEITMKKYLATGSTRQGTLFVNPGGPGYSGVEMVENNETESSPILNQAYDIVGFDPYGAGASTPIICDDGAGQQPAKVAQGGIGVNGLQPDSLVADVAGDGSIPFRDVENPAIDGGVEANVAFLTLIEEVSKDFKQEEANCAAYTKLVGLLDHVDTVSVAQDLDILWALPGDQKLNHLGFSYGIYLGVYYVELFPANTGRMVLDGAIDPSLSLGGRASGQAQGLEIALRTYVQQCQSGRAVQEGQSCPLTGDADAGVQQARIPISSVDQAPLKTSDSNVTAGGSMIRSVVRRFLYTSECWSLLTYVLDQAITQKDGSYVQVLYGKVVAGGSAPTFHAVNCPDISAQDDMISWEKEYQQIPQSSSIFGASLGNQDTRYQAWGHNGICKPAFIHAKGVAPILVVGTVDDPTTPYAWSQALVDRLESGRFLTWEGNGRTAYGRSGACVQKAVDTYPINGATLEGGLTYKNGQ